MKQKIWKKRMLSGALMLCICGGITGGHVKDVLANPHYDRKMTVAPEEYLPSVESSDAGAARAVSPNAWQKINGICYNGSGVKIPGAITRGIDVSEWQGTINWAQVKQSDVDFAFVRISYGTGYMDKKYDYNMEQAEKAGVPVGTYVYSLATSTSGALKEAQLAIEKMKGYKVSYPVVYDLEAPSAQYLSPQEKSKMILTFCNEIKKAGYYPMLYCNAYWYKNHVDWSLLSGVDVWIASYGDRIQAPSSASYSYSIWQATDGNSENGLNTTRGLIAGIPASNDVDINFGYVDYTKHITPRKQPLSSYEPSSVPNIGAVNAKNGWKEENGKTYYYVNDKKVTGWEKINGSYYYFNKSTGEMYRNKFFQGTDGNNYYVDKNGKRPASKWITYNGKTYYISKNGYALKNMKKVDGKYYYFHTSNSYLCKNKKIIKQNGNIYYFGKDGARYEDGWYEITENGQTHTYYFRENGTAYKGWLTLNGKKYYMYKGTSTLSGVRAENITLTSASSLCSVFDKNGVCVRQYKE